MPEETQARTRKPRTKSGYRMGHHLPEIRRITFRKGQWQELSNSAGFKKNSRARNKLRLAYSMYLTCRVALQFFPYAREVGASLRKSSKYVDDVAAQLASLQNDRAFEQAQRPSGNLFGLDVDVGVYNIDTVDRLALTELGSQARNAYDATCNALNALHEAETKYRELSQRALERAHELEDVLKPKVGRISREEYYEPEIWLLTCLAREMAKRSLSLKVGSTSSTNEKWKSYPYPKAAVALLTFALSELPQQSQTGSPEIAPAYFPNNLANGSAVTLLRVLEIARKSATKPQTSS